MKSLVYKQFGGTDVLQIIDIETPSHGKNEILVKVISASINPIDWKFRKGEMKMMSGKTFPQFVGSDFSGIVKYVGTDVTEFKAGDEVLGFINKKKGGAMQESVVVTSDLIVKKPSNISFEKAATIPTVGMAAYIALFEKAKITKGQSILINGCTGSVGLWATQIAMEAGLEITGVCSSNGMELARKLGCQRVIDYRKQKVMELKEAYDIVFDTASSMTFADAKRLLKPNGVFLNPTPNLQQIIGSLFINLISRKKHKVVLGSPNKNNLQKLADYAHDGFELLVHKTFVFVKNKEAYAYAEKGGFIGKIVVSLE
ncbi:NAD(P)-dependent alcohol dehydrogenase [soil metagenome]